MMNDITPTIEDANIICLPGEVKILQELGDINDELKTLEIKKQSLVSDVKNIMKSHNVSKLTLGTHEYNMVVSNRRTVSKNNKNNFICELIAAGKKYLVHTEIEPNLDEIFAEVEDGTIDAELINKYVKVTSVTSLRVT